MLHILLLLFSHYYPLPQPLLSLLYVYLLVLLVVCSGLLNDDQLGTIFKEVYGAREKWRNIGLIIGVKIGDLKVIRADHRDVDDCCQEMLYKWLTNSSERTWRILAEALENETVGFPNIAETIRKKYIENV